MSDAVRQATERLRAAGIETARLEARLLREHSQRNSLSPTGGEDWGEGEMFESLISRRLSHEPIAYIIGEKEFWSLPFAVGPGALIPRPETETLIEAAMREFPDREAQLRALDLGTGSGCLVVTFLTNYLQAYGAGIDVSQDALKWACANASGEITQLASDVSEHEPASALDGGADGLAAYRALAPLLRNNLASKGCAFLEIGQGQHHMVARILQSEGLQVARIVEDLAGIPRCVVARRG